MEEKKPFFEEPFIPVNKMTKEQLAEELTRWRNLWGWIDMEVKGWLIKVGHTFKFVRRDYRVFFGTLGKTHFDPTLLELDCVVQEKDYIRKAFVTEVETITIPINQLIDWEEVYEHTEEPIDERGDVIEEAEEIAEKKLEKELF